MRAQRVHTGLLALVLTALPLSGFADASAGTGQQDDRWRQRQNDRRVGTAGVTQMRFRGMDRNGDGVITRDEWRGNDRSFRVHDRNRDNVLSGDELRNRAVVGTGARWERRFENIDLDDSGRIERDEWPWANDDAFDRLDDNNDGVITRGEFASREDETATIELFQEFDFDNDGRISLREWRGDRRRFELADGDRNGYLSRREFLAGDTPLAAQDRNNDSLISRAEWYGDPDVFDELDRDRNGVLTRTEYLGPSGNVVTPEPGSTGFFADMDYNRNGRIETYEWNGGPETFRRLDRNRDGWLSREEFANRPSSMTFDAEFAGLDRNGDGRISRSEWSGERGVFDRIDRNGDGMVTRTEYGFGSAATVAEAEFTEIDRNRDGRIARSEWSGERGVFDRLDRNRDNVLTRTEFFEQEQAVGQGDRAYQAGLERGRKEGASAGRDDRNNRRRFDADSRDEMFYAHSGYDPRLGSIQSYQAGYRTGFVAGYRDGYYNN